MGSTPLLPSARDNEQTSQCTVVPRTRYASQMHELTHQAHYLRNVSETVKENNSLPPTPTITTKLIGVSLLRVAGIADSGAVVWFGALSPQHSNLSL